MLHCNKHFLALTGAQDVTICVSGSVGLSVCVFGTSLSKAPKTLMWYVLFSVSYDDVDPRCLKTRTIDHIPYISFLLLLDLRGELCGLTKLRNSALATTWGSEYDSRNYVGIF